MRRAVCIFSAFTRGTGHWHPRLETARGNYFGPLVEMGRTEAQAEADIRAIAPELLE